MGIKNNQAWFILNQQNDRLPPPPPEKYYYKDRFGNFYVNRSGENYIARGAPTSASKYVARNNELYTDRLGQVCTSR